MLTSVPFAGRTSTALCSSLKVRTALDSLPFESGAVTRLNDVSSARPRVQARSTRRVATVFFTVLEVYRSGGAAAWVPTNRRCPISRVLCEKAGLSLSKGGDFHPPGWTLTSETSFH